MPRRPLPPVAGPLSSEFLEREERLAARETELRTREQNLLDLERALQARSRELDERETKLRQWEETLRAQKKNQIQVLAQNIQEQTLPDVKNYNPAKVTRCQQFIKRFLHSKRLLAGEAQPRTVLELLRVIQQKDSSEWKEKQQNHFFWSARFEILATEERYVNDLTLIFKHYLTPLFGYSKTSDMQQVFGNLEEIFRINIEFLSNLKHGFYQTLSADLHLPDSFTMLIQKMSAYTEYYLNFDQSNVMRQKLKASSKYKAFLDDLQAKSPTPNFDLDSYLIKPCQRLPRYKLLLEAVTKLMPPTHRDLLPLTKATEQLDRVIITINERKRDDENRQQVALIASKLQCPGNFNLLDTDRRLVHHAALNLIPPKTPKHSWRAGRTGYLFSDVLLATKSRVLSYMQTVVCIIDLKEEMILEDFPDTEGNPHHLHCLEYLYSPSSFRALELLCHNSRRD